MAISKEEEKEFEELALLEEFEAQDSTSVDIEVAPKDIEEPTTVEALSTGFVEGVPFLKDAVAGYDAISDAVASEEPLELGKVYDRYKENLEDINETINIVEDKAPVASTAGDIAGGLVIGMPLAKAGMAGAAGLGAASGLSRAEDRTIKSAAAGAALGMAGEKLGQLAGKAVKKAGQFTKKAIMKHSDEALQSIIGADRSYGASKVFDQLKKTNQSIDDFVSSIRKTKVNGDDLIAAGDTPEDVLEKVVVAKNNAGSALGNLFKEVDDQFKVEIDVPRIKARLKADVVDEFIKSDDPGTREIGASLSKFIDELGVNPGNVKKTLKPSGQVDPAGAPIMVEEVVEEITRENTWSLTRLHSLQKDINKRISSVFDRKGINIEAAKEQERLVANAIGDIIDDTLDQVPAKADSTVLQQAQNLRKQFGNMATIDKILTDRVRKSGKDWQDLVKKAFSFRSIATSSIATAHMGPAGLLAGPVMATALSNPKLPSYIAAGLPKLAQAVVEDPASKLASRLVLASSLSSEKFEKEIKGGIAEINLRTNPIPRTTDKAFIQYEDIKNFLKRDLPSQAQIFEEVVENGDSEEMARFLDSMSKTREGSKYFEAGVGFNGKVYSPEDKAMFETQLKSADIPAAQRMQMIKSLRGEGIIPDLQSVKPRFKMNYNPRQNKQPKY